MRQTSWYICAHSAGGSTRTFRSQMRPPLRLASPAHRRAQSPSPAAHPRPQNAASGSGLARASSILSPLAESSKLSTCSASFVRLAVFPNPAVEGYGYRKRLPEFSKSKGCRASPWQVQVSRRGQRQSHDPRSIPARSIFVGMTGLSRRSALSFSSAFAASAALVFRSAGLFSSPGGRSVSFFASALRSSAVFSSPIQARWARPGPQPAQPHKYVKSHCRDRWSYRSCRGMRPRSYWR